MRRTFKNVIALLETHAEREWRELKYLEEHPIGNRTAAEQERVTAQRARWCAWDEAVQIAKGERTI